MDTVRPQRVIVVGAGHVGLYAALRLSKKLNARRAEIVVIDPQPHMTYQPFLPESAAGNISPRHTAVPLRRALKRCPVLPGRAARLGPARPRGAAPAPATTPPRHAVVPLRRELKRCHVLSGRVTRIEHARKVAVVQP